MNADYRDNYSYPNEEIIDDPEALEVKKTIRVVLVEPGKLAREAEIGTKLEDLQAAVGGGWIETFYPFESDEMVCVVVDDEGKLNGSLPNRAVYEPDGRIEDIIFGPFFICDCSKESFGSLSPEQIEKYKEKFYQPEHFYMVGGEILAEKYTPVAEKGAR